MHEIIKSKDKEGKSTEETDKHSFVPEDLNKDKVEDHVWPIMREDEPGCEWTENNEIIGGYFPFLFLRGYKILPKSTFPTSLIRHLLLYYDGISEKSQHLIHLLYNQQIGHVAIIKIARSGSSNKQYLEKLSPER